MAGFRMHVSTAAACGVGYGLFAMRPLGFPPDAAILAGTLTAFGGMLPDLDSDTGKPIRFVFGLAAAILPMLLIPRLHDMHLSHEAMLLTLIILYMVIRYGLSRLLSRISVHRGMFHSIPAMFIAGLFVYMEYGSTDRTLRGLLAGGIMLGFLSHLILDEIYSVDVHGLRVRLKSSAGSAFKFFSPSLKATVTCYAILGILANIAWLDWKNGGEEAWKDYWAKVDWKASLPARIHKAP